VLNGLLIIAGSLIALFFLEFAARFLPLPFDDSRTNPAETCWPATGWRGRPHFQTTIATDNYVHDLQLNSQGMHDTEHALVKTPGTSRILLLGDSFVHAIQVRETETSHQVLEDLFNQAQPDTTYEVISGGVSGWGTGQQLLYYRAEGRNYQPDLVVLMFYMGNDVKDNLPGRGITVGGQNCYSPYFLLENGQLDPTPWQYAPGLPPAVGTSFPLQKWAGNLLGLLHRHSALYAQLEPFLAPEPVSASMLDFYAEDTPTFDYGLALTYELVAQLAHEVNQDGAQFAVVLISPLSLVEFSQMNAEQREQVYQELPVMRRAEDIPSPNETLVAEFSRRGIPVLDLLPAFIEQGGTAFYFEQDKHWNSQGNQLAAKVIYRWITEQGRKEAP
jgi:lysophospholipase L1-like esterase